MKLTDEQSQLVFGTLLGKSYLSKPKHGANFFLTMPDTKDSNWLDFKAEIMCGHERKSAFQRDKVRRWRSKSNVLWTKVYNDFYKKFDMDTLNPLRPATFMVWFLDKGFFPNKRQVCLKTTSFGMKGNNIIKTFFDEVDMPCIIKEERDTGRILFTEEGTYNFLKCVAPHVPQFMLYRLEEKEPFYEEIKDACAKLAWK